jgi:hypothetical protein
LVEGCWWLGDQDVFTRSTHGIGGNGASTAGTCAGEASEHDASGYGTAAGDVSKWHIVARYEFVTEWTFQAPLDRVWDEIAAPERWPEWWKAVLAVVPLAPGDASGIGAIRRYTWRGVLPYTLSFDMTTTRSDRYVCLEGDATGELRGHGCWRFSSSGPETRVRYDWHVEATKRWMTLLAPVARPAFEWNHDVVMRWGFDGLSRRLRS